MEQVKEFLIGLDDKVRAIVQPVVDWIMGFLGKEPYFAILIVASFLAILVIAGIIGMLRRARVLFFILLILAAGVFCAWYFIVL